MPATKFALLMVSMYFLAGCRPQPTIGGVPVLKLLETERAKAGIRLVKSDWKIERMQPDNVRWAYPLKDGGGLAKVAWFNATSLQWEEDYYHTGRSYPSADGDATSYEQLTIHYDFVTGKCAVRIITDNPTLEAKIPAEVWEGTTPAEAFAVADTILSVWGLKRG